MYSKTMPPAILFVITHPDETVTEEQYHAWYDGEHLPGRFSVPGVRSALRFVSPDSKRWLAYYDLDSLDVLKSKEYALLKENASDNEKAIIPHVNMDRRVYKLIASVGEQVANPPKTILVVEMTPYRSHEKEFHHWYDTYHIPQMADLPGWSRSRRFELVEPEGGDVCKFLTMHEFDKENAVGNDRANTVKWRNEVIEIVTARARSTWNPYHPANEPSGVHIVNHGGIQFNVKVDGKEDGPAIALCNPLGWDIRVWDGVVEALAPAYRIVRHDQRGHGRTTQPTKPTTFPELTDDLVAILDYLKIPKLHALIGCSMGGVIALDFGIRHPQRVEKIIPCDADPYSSPEKSAAWDDRIALLKKNGIGPLAEQTANRWFTDGWKSDPANQKTLNAVRDQVARIAPNAYIANASALADYNYIEPAKGLKVPCLLVCGAQDKPLQSMKELEKIIPGGRLVEIESCGHLPMIERPKAFLDVLKNYL